MKKIESILKWLASNDVQVNSNELAAEMFFHEVFWNVEWRTLSSQPFVYVSWGIDKWGINNNPPENPTKRTTDVLIPLGVSSEDVADTICLCLESAGIDYSISKHSSNSFRIETKDQQRITSSECSSIRAFIRSFHEQQC